MTAKNFFLGAGGGRGGAGLWKIDGDRERSQQNLVRVDRGIKRTR